MTYELPAELCVVPEYLLNYGTAEIARRRVVSRALNMNTLLNIARDSFLFFSFFDTFIANHL